MSQRRLESGLVWEARWSLARAGDPHGARYSVRLPNRPLRGRPGTRTEATGGSQQGRFLARARARKAQAGAAAVGRGGGPREGTARSLVTGGGSAAPTRGEGERAASVLIEGTAMVMFEQQAVRPDGSAPPCEVEAAAPLGRHRPHRFPARGHVVKVLYSEEERDTVERAAEVAGLRPSSCVATAALRMAPLSTSIS